MLDELLNRVQATQNYVEHNNLLKTLNCLFIKEQQVVQHFNASNLIAEPENTAAFHGI